MLSDLVLILMITQLAQANHPGRSLPVSSNSTAIAFWVSIDVIQPEPR